MERELKDLVEEILTESNTESVFSEDDFGREYISGEVFIVDARRIEELCRIAGIDICEFFDLETVLF